MREADTPHKGQHAWGYDERTWTNSSGAEAVTRSMESPSDRGRNSDTSILIHLVLLRVFLCRTIENKISIQRKQAGTLNVGKSHKIR